MIVSLEHKVLDLEIDEFEVVNFSNYVRWFGDALREFLSCYSRPAGFFGDGLEVRVGRMRVAYSNSARRGDTVLVGISRADHVGRSLRLYLQARGQDKVLARAELDLAFVRTQPYGLVPVPEELTARLAASQSAGVKGDGL